MKANVSCLTAGVYGRVRRFWNGTLHERSADTALQFGGPPERFGTREHFHEWTFSAFLHRHPVARRKA